MCPILAQKQAEEKRLDEASRLILQAEKTISPSFKIDLLLSALKRDPSRKTEIHKKIADAYLIEAKMHVRIATILPCLKAAIEYDPTRKTEINNKIADMYMKASEDAFLSKQATSNYLKIARTYASHDRIEGIDKKIAAVGKKP